MNILKIWTSRYSFSWSGAPGAREGALLKVLFADQKIGYSDLHPWPEFGEIPLDRQLTKIKEHQGTPEALVSLSLARRDAEARFDEIDLLWGSDRIKNHFLVLDLSRFSLAELEKKKSEGYSTLKIKVGRNPAEELKHFKVLSEGLNFFKLRLDFNAKLSISDFYDFMAEFPSQLKSKIEYIEDPCEDWWKAEISLDFPLATDWAWQKEKDQQYCDKIVIKPARVLASEIEELKKFGKELIFTNALDHPVGRAQAVALALSTISESALTQTLHGLQFPESLAEFEEFDGILQVGPGFQTKPDLGIGMTHSLQKLSWSSLVE